ncbi:FAD:protein FMN transferase [Rhabdothermincola sp.]|uniref:FAD:protein FMN transferase n=1 Tax=Rhabdothermincola sp. TaxID=2820405 RepID=UPI002FE3B4E4
MRAERQFPVMGSEAHVIVVGAAAGQLVGLAVRELEALEERWSRFRPDSELSRLNAVAGTPLELSPVTFDAVQRAVEAWRDTFGYYDPTVLPALERVGYDRSFELLAHAGRRPRIEGPLPCPGCVGIELDPATRTVRLPAGVAIDLGGIGKGLAADLVCEHLLDAGADGASVNVGGDVRVAGASPSPDGWVIDVDDRAVVSLAEGAVATSSTTRRCWTVGGRGYHHLIDPATGLPAESDLVTVSVVGATAAFAEVVGKAVLIAGRSIGSSIVVEHQMAALMVGADRGVSRVGGFEEYELAGALA